MVLKVPFRVDFQFYSTVIWESAWYNFNFLKFIEVHFTAYHIISLGETSTLCWIECVFCNCWMKSSVYVLLSPFVPRYSLNPLFLCWFSVLMTCIVLLVEYWNPHYYCVAIYSFCMSSNNCFINLGPPMLGAYIFRIVIFSCWTSLFIII